MRLTAKLVHVAAIVAAASGCGGAVAANATYDDGGTTDGGKPDDGGSRDATTADVGSGGQDASAMDGEAADCRGTPPYCYGNDTSLCCGGSRGPATCVNGAWMCGSSPAPGCDGTTCGTDGGGDGGGDGGDACAPKTCAQLGYNCGAPADGCGGTLNCGSCTNPQFCGGGGYFMCGGNDGLDAAPDSPLVGCAGCGCTGATVAASTACQMLEESYSYPLSMYASGRTCQQACAEAGFAQGPLSFVECALPQSFVSEVQSLNPDGGVATADGGGGTLDCPTSPATLTVTCSTSCVGRLTEGYSAPDRMRSEGERLAAMAYLEAVSVHAFERLERELEVHRAPPVLLRAARRARRDEVRHTAMTTRLARRHGGASPRLPDAPAPTRARALFEVALENAVEGCIRETYGAVQGLVEAQTSREHTMRRAMKSIAADECRHAELAWAVHAWAMPRLTEGERRAVQRAMKDAVAEIAIRDPRTASLLFSEEQTAIA